ncbi:MAG: TolC family protein [Acidobacteriota bacterium]|nr:TolC family protein [Acidobacteriota bacterium]
MRIRERWRLNPPVPFLFCLMALAGSAQTPVDRSPSVSYNTGIPGTWRPGSVSQTELRDSPRMHDLVRAGQLYLSLQDAIALALENNLDLELERYGVRMAGTDTLRAKGGGLPRGVPLTVNDPPAGVGGPGQQLNNSAASGVTPQTTLPVSATDSQLIQEIQESVATTGAFPLSTGPAIPQYDPALTGQLLAQHTTTPETSLVITGTPALNANSLAGNFGYTQGFSTGAQVAATFQNTRSNSNSVRNLIDPFYNSSLGVTVTQPLLRGFGIELNRRYIRIAKNSEKISDNVFRLQASVTVSGVIRLYSDLVSLNEDLEVKQDTLVTAQHLEEDNRNKVDQGILAPIELTRARAQVTAARQDLANSEGFLRQQELIMKNVLSRDPAGDPAVHAARIIPTDPLVVDPLPTQTADEMVAVAMESRPDYQAAKLQLTNTEITLKGSRNGLLPELDLIGSMSNSGLAGAPNPNYAAGTGGTAAAGSPLLGYGDGYGAALGQVLKRNYPSYSVGINLTLPLRDRTAQADVARDELQLRQTQVRTRQLENQIRLQVEDALIALQRTHGAYEAALETRKLQDESLAIEQERYNNGLSTNFLVIQYQNLVAQARSTEVAARGTYAKARSQLEAVMGIVLRNHNVSLAEAFKGQSPRLITPELK